MCPKPATICYHVSLASTLLMNSDVRAALTFAADIVIQPIYVTSYPSRTGIPSSADIQTKITHDLVVANTVFSQIGINVVARPLVEQAITVSSPSSSLTQNGVWLEADFDLLRRQDAYRNDYAEAHVVPVYVVPDYDKGGTPVGSRIGETYPPLDTITSPGEYAAILIERSAANLTLAHEIGHFLVNRAQFADRVAALKTNGIDIDNSHLSDPFSLLYPSSNPALNSISDFAPIGNFGRIGFAPTIEPPNSGDRPTNQVWAMHHRGYAAGYLNYPHPTNGFSSPAHLTIKNSDFDHVGDQLRYLKGSYVNVGWHEPSSNGLEIKTFSIFNPPGELLPYSVQVSARRVKAEGTDFLDFSFQLDFNSPYSFSFQGGTDGDFTLEGSVAPFVYPLDLSPSNVFVGDATLLNANLCVDRLCEMSPSASVKSFSDTTQSFPGIPRIIAGFKLSFQNADIVGAEALQWTIRVPAILDPLQFAADFNDDDKVDSADYVVWRKGLGIHYAMADYTNWRASFGQNSSVAGSGSFVLRHEIPEPPSASLVGLLIAAICSRKRWQVNSPSRISN